MDRDNLVITNNENQEAMKFISGSENIWSKNSFDNVKGILAICVLLHHIYQFTGVFSNSYFGHFLSLLGRWAVAGFIFMSGYGLYASYKAKGEKYISSFIKKRVLPFYGVYLVYVLVYLIYEIIMRTPLDIWLVLKSFTFGGTVISFGWYLQMSIFYYICFYLAFYIKGKCIRGNHEKDEYIKSEYIKDEYENYTLTKEGFIDKKKTWKMTSLLLVVFLLLYSVAAYFLGDGHYEALPSFLLGIIFSVHSEKLKTVFSRISLLFMLLSFAGFFGIYLLFVFGIIMGRFPVETNVWQMCGMASDLCVCIFIMSFLSLVKGKLQQLICNPVFSFAGLISLEIYVCQGVVLRTLGLYITSKMLYIFLAVLLDILLATGVHFGIGKLKKWVLSLK